MKVLFLGILIGQQNLAFPSSLVHGSSHYLSTSAPLLTDLCLQAPAPLASLMIFYSSSKVQFKCNSTRSFFGYQQVDVQSPSVFSTVVNIWSLCQGPFPKSLGKVSGTEWMFS